MTTKYVPHLPWETAFLDALLELKVVRRAAQEAGVTTGAISSRRKRSEEFAQECQRILDKNKESERAPTPSQWKRMFLEALAETSNVRASAQRARITTREVYKLRREDTDFAGDWQAALYEGYVNLEMEVLGYLRNPKPERKMDVANALRLLAAHKETVAKEQAVRTNVSTAEVRASIDRKVEEIRQRVMRGKNGQRQNGSCHNGS